MKTRIYTIALSAITLLISCQQMEDKPAADKTFKLIAVQDNGEASKTVISGEKSVFWEPAEEIKVFKADGTGYLFKSANTEPAASAVFSGELTVDDVAPGEELWAVYPFSDGATFDGEAITTVLPSNQVARPESFARNMNLSVARTTGNKLQFYNVGGGVRFSVTQEGIGKVIFEGLNGEILSGKVTIGFEEGVPVVKEVSGGSMFITLTPPDGETFQTGKWYYMVAIPGALEQGYKLRFYKGEDYAKKVSEASVTIKRGVFGSVAEADKGNEYEPTSTSFPETEEEIEESMEMMSSINNTVNDIISGSSDVSSIIDEIQNVDGVIDVISDASLNTIAVQQKDGMWINYLLDSEQLSFSFSEENETYESNAIPSRLVVPSQSTSYITSYSSGEAFFNNGGKAIILAPYVFDYNLAGFKTDLIAAGVGVNDRDIVIKSGVNDTDSAVDEKKVFVTDFLGSNLSQYDVVIIVSHGGIGCNVYHQKDKPLATIIDTGVPYSEERAEALLQSGTMSFKDLSFVGNADHLTFAMTKEYLDGAHFNNSCVCLMACHSAERGDDEGSLVRAFLEKGAGLVSGNNREVHSTVTSRINRKLTYLMSKGLSYQGAFKQIIESEWLDSFCDNWYRAAFWFNSSQKARLSAKESFDVKNFYVIKQNPKLGSREYYLTNPFPSSLSENLKDDGIELSWACRLKPFSDSWYFPDPSRIREIRWDFIPYLSPAPKEKYEIMYDVFVDDCQVGQIRDIENQHKEKKVNWTPDTRGISHTWYVNASILKGNSIIATYKSNLKDFTDKENSSAKIKVSKTSLVFDDTQVGQTSEMDWTITNIGDATLKVSSITVPEGFSTDFSSWSSKSLEPTASHTFKVYFKPTEAKQYSGKLMFKSNAVNAQNQGFTIGGKGVSTDVVLLQFDPMYIHFWDTEVGKTAQKEWTITNAGNVRMEVYGLSVPDGFSTDFSSWKEKYLSPGASHTFNIYFSPKHEGTYSGKMVLKSNTTGYPEAYCDISGDAYEIKKAVISVSTETINFGEKKIGETATSSVVISNKGNANLNIWSVSGPSSGVFTTDYETWGSTTIEPNGKRTLKVYFKPAEATYYNVYIAIGSDASNVEGIQFINVTGTGVEPESYSAEYVDLGLTVLWANCNLGAKVKEGSGYSYRWGESDVNKAANGWANYKWCKGTDHTLTKYCSDSKYGYNGFTDNKTVLEPADDAAYCHLGNQWHTPTDAEWTELREQCTWEKTTINGIAGYRITSKIPGYTSQWIFLPTERTEYWSSTLATPDPNYSEVTPSLSWCISITKTAVYRSQSDRIGAYPIRPVRNR